MGFLLLCFLAAASAQGLGDRLTRSALIYRDLPLTAQEALGESLLSSKVVLAMSRGSRYASGASFSSLSPFFFCSSFFASAAGWVISPSCDPKLGFQATQARPQPARSTPVSLYFSASGAVSGYATEIYGDVAAAPLQAGYYLPTGPGLYRITIGFRSGRVCDHGATFNSPVGDVLFVVNHRGGADFSIPLTAASAVQRGFTKGACIGGMGTHYSYDLASRNGTMTWVADNLLPLMPMYDSRGLITAMLIPSKTSQFQFVYKPNQHDGIIM